MLPFRGQHTSSVSLGGVSEAAGRFKGVAPNVAEVTADSATLLAETDSTSFVFLSDMLHGFFHPSGVLIPCQENGEATNFVVDRYNKS